MKYFDFSRKGTYLLFQSINYDFNFLSSTGWGYFLLDFCYVVNAITIAYFIGSILAAGYGYSFPALFPNIAKYVFEVGYIWSMGPLAISVALFRNSLVFHSFDHISILAVHIGPPLSFYGVRWYMDSLNSTFPNAFNVDIESEQELSVESMFKLTFIPIICYLLIWTIPYYLTIFVFMASDIRVHNYVTMFSYYEKDLEPVFKFFRASPALKPVIYLFLHGTLCFISFFIAYAAWNSFAFNTIYLIILFFISVWNGSTYYFKVYF